MDRRFDLNLIISIYIYVPIILPISIEENSNRGRNEYDIVCIFYMY